MTGRWRISAIAMLAATMLVFGANSSMAAPRAHVYLLRGLLNIFSLGMDTLASELNKRGVYATVDNHADWQSLADGAAARYKAGSEGPIILIGHSLGADAVMEMAAYLGKRGVPVALVVPFDGTQHLYAPANVARVLNLTQRDYAYAYRGPGFHGSLVNVNVSGDPNIDHLTIDKSPRLHARVIAEVLAIVGSHRGEPGAVTAAREATKEAAKKTQIGRAAPNGEAVKPESATAPAAKAEAKTDTKTDTKTDARTDGQAASAKADQGTPVIALPEPAGTRSASDAAAAASKN